MTIEKKMGMLIDGQWSNEDQRRLNKSGAFERPVSPFRSWLGEDPFTVEASRYHLFVNAGCPWAYRTILYRSVKSLASTISISYTRPAAGGQGWTFEGVGEPLLGAEHIHNVYTASTPDFTGRCTVPVLWDKKDQTIVSNESADIIRMMNDQFDALPGVNAVDFYPLEHRAEIDALNEWIYSDVNNGVYRCGFAQSQSAYDEAYAKLFRALDVLDTMLKDQRYLCGDVVTEADWRLFATLVRFDAAYYGQFKCNRNRLVEFENLWPYTRDLYAYPGVSETVDIAAIKGIYYGSRPPGIIPGGPDLDFSEAVNRA